MRELERAITQIGSTNYEDIEFRSGEFDGWGGAQRRMEAFCMGLHPRLGKGSRVSGLDPSLVDALLRAYVAPRRCIVLH